MNLLFGEWKIEFINFSNYRICLNKIVYFSGFILTTLLLIHYFSDITKLILGGYYSTENVSVLIQSQSKHYSWLLKLLLNCFGYSCILLPGYFIIKYVRLKNYLEKNDGKTSRNFYFTIIIT